MLQLTDKFGVVLVFDPADTRPAIEIPEVKEVLGRLGQVTLGASVREGYGYWHPTGEFERSIDIFTCYDGSVETWTELLDNVLPTVINWANSTEQEAVAFIEGNALVIVDTPDLDDYHLKLKNAIRRSEPFPA